MEPDPNLPKHQKSSECPVSNQLNRYRNSLPQIERSQNHFFFKQVHQSDFQVVYVTIGYRVGQVPFQLMDLFSVVINQIHCFADCNLKIVMDGDQLYVTSTVGFLAEQINSTRYNIEEAHISQALSKTQKLILAFLERRKRQTRTEDRAILEQVRKVICKEIVLIFKNPNLDD